MKKLSTHCLVNGVAGADALSDFTGVAVSFVFAGHSGDDYISVVVAGVGTNIPQSTGG